MGDYTCFLCRGGNADFPPFALFAKYVKPLCYRNSHVRNYGADRLLYLPSYERYRKQARFVISFQNTSKTEKNILKF